MHRHRTRLLLLAALPLALAPMTAGAEPIEVAVDKTGWWNRANTTTATPAGPISVPPPPGIPPGSLVVGALGVEPTAIAAVGARPLQAGQSISRFELVLEEDTAATGNLGGGDASLVACPIVEFWVGGENGDWATRPIADCELASGPGTRDDDGRWTFDLRAVGEVWFDPFGTTPADGVVIVPAAGSTASFQVVFRSDPIVVTLDAEPVPEDDAFAAPIPDPPADAGFSGGAGGIGSIFSPPTLSLPPVQPDLPDAVEQPGTEDVEEAAPVGASAPAPDTSRAGEVLGNLPLSTILLVLAALVVLGATSYWLGPAGQPVTTIRQRGVSQALDRRARAGKVAR